MKPGVRINMTAVSETHHDEQLLRGLAPVLSASPRLLILGSMPGKVSLEQQQYYAHPRNAFWPIMTALLDKKSDMSYTQRCRMLTKAHIALWDVIGACRRHGSLDANIVRGSEEVNDITGLAERYTSLRAIALNGGTAYTLYRRHIHGRLPPPAPAILRLPSTSPANAGMTLADKEKIWREALQPYCDK